MIEYGVRRTGGGIFYLVTIDEYGDAHGFYADGALVKFESSQEAKDYIRGIDTSQKLPPKKKGRIF